MATRLIPARLPGLQRLPLDSTAPIVWFAVIRVLVVMAAALSRLVVGFPLGGRLIGVLLVVALPWALLLLLLARRRPNAALHPLVAYGDFLVLVAIESVVPETYSAVRFLGLFFVAAHAHFQGERVGSAIALAGTISLVIAGSIIEDPIETELITYYEVLFCVSAVATAAVIGGLRTAESAGRIEARELTRRTIEAEDALRRHLAEAIHDGPVQELVSLEMMLAAARKAGERGDHERATELLGQASGLASRNVHTLREEIVGLGPDAFRELSFEAAVEESVPIWNRRYGVPISMQCERVELHSDVEGALFRIASEAVANAGRHAGATKIDLRLRRQDGRVELTVADDGSGFRDAEAFWRPRAGHLGLAGMRERAEAVGGALQIATGDNGTVVRVSAPAER
ncbi:MAG: ATP-binding protein [Thermoleophilaceae bacterium]